MDWLQELLFSPSAIQTVILIAVVSAFGLLLGKVKVMHVSLGITFVFFVGIIVGHFKLPMNDDMLQFAQNFGLILFVYALGLQVGPGFFASLNKAGLRLNMLSLTVVICGCLLLIAALFATNISVPDLVGILSGAVTNTPALGAAQQALEHIAPNDADAIAEMTLACAVTYPIGVVGVIIALIVIRRFAPGADAESENDFVRSKPFVTEFSVINADIVGKTVFDLMKHSPKHFVISRVWKEGKVTIPTSEYVLALHDHLLVVCKEQDTDAIRTLFGEQEQRDWNREDIDWNHIDNSNLVSRRIIVTNSKMNGVRLGSLKLRNLFGINITRVNRAGIDLLSSPDLMLQIGDRLMVVGERASIDNVAKILGNEVKRLNVPNLIPVFLGIALGLVLGALPIPFPGLSVPIRLGIAAGPMIVGILFGAFGPRLHLITYSTQSANLMLREVGIVTYLACLGLSAGRNFFATILHGDGLLWLAIGAIITIIPVIIIGLISLKVFKLNYGEVCGMLCGSMANPMALNFANSTVDSDAPAVSYATVYPLAMFVRIITMQLLIMILI